MQPPLRLSWAEPCKITAEIKRIVEEYMRLDDETTAYQLHRLLSEKGYSISLHMILHCRTALGWTFQGSAYCQLIREANKTKRLTWAQEHLRLKYVTPPFVFYVLFLLV